MTKTDPCVISGFHHSGNEICTLLGVYTALKIWPIVCPKTSVTNYHSTLCTIPEEHRSQKQIKFSEHCGNLKSTKTGSSPKCKFLPDHMASHPRWHSSFVTTATSTLEQCILFRAPDNKQRSETTNHKCIILLYQKPLTLSVLYYCTRNP
jgi:hypothetical protein